MKKLLSLIVAAALLLSFCACVPESGGVSSLPGGGTSDGTGDASGEISSGNTSSDGDSGNETPPEDEPAWPESISAASISLPSSFEKTENGLYRIPDVPSDMFPSNMQICGNTLLLTEGVYIGDGSGHDYAEAVIYNISAGAVTARKRFDGEVYVSLLSENRVCVVNDAEGIFDIYDSSLKLIHSYCADMDSGDFSLVCWAVSEDGKYLLSRSDDGRSVTVTDMSAGKNVAVFETKYPVYECFSYEGDFYLTGSSSPHVARIDGGTFEITWFDMSNTLSAVSIGLLLRDSTDTDIMAVSPSVKPTVTAFIKNASTFTAVDYTHGCLVYSSYDYGSEGNLLYVADLASQKLYSLDMSVSSLFPSPVISENGYVVLSDGDGFYLWKFLDGDSSELEAEIMSDDEVTAEIENTCSALKEKYGVSVYYGLNGNDFKSDGYLSKTVTDPYTILSAVRSVSDTLALYPDGMIPEMYAGEVRSIDLYLSGSLYPITSTGIDSAIGLTFTSGSTRVIVADISYSLDELDTTMVHELMHIMDDKLEAAEAETGIPYISAWEDLLPDGITYYYSYNDKYGNIISNINYTMAEGIDSRIWFVDAYSKTFPTEDRARVMEYLMRGYFDDDPDAIRGEHLLMKARYLCVIIRECFTCIDDDDVLPWETILGPIDRSEFEEILLPNVEAA